jgi:hypothetical protein
MDEIRNSPLFSPYKYANSAIASGLQAMRSAGEGESHMNDLEIASYLDRGLSAQDRSRVEDHLVECSECREIRRGERKQLMTKLRRPRRLAAFAGLAAVAAAALFVVSPALMRARQPLDLVTRDAGTSSTLVCVRANRDGGESINSFFVGAPRPTPAPTDLS